MDSNSINPALGCEGVHRGVGTDYCPAVWHHHHNERCLFRAQELALREAAETIEYTINFQRTANRLNKSHLDIVKMWLKKHATLLGSIDTPDSALLASTGQRVQSSSAHRPEGASNA